MTSLAIKCRPVGLHVQSRPRQLNIQTLNSVKIKAENNKDFQPINRLNSSNASDCYGPKQYSTPKLVNNEMLNVSNDLKIEIRTYVLKLLEDLESNINNENLGKSTIELIANVCNYLKEHGSYLDEDLSFKEQMDVYFNLLRNILRNSKLDRLSRALILEVIELRASDWVYNKDIDTYYRNKISDLESNHSFSTSCEMSRGLKTSQSSGSIISPSSGNEIVKSSGKFVKPTKVPGKTFLKDEVVIRNGDSGKVNPGAKERLVQITGPSEENIERAKELIENTIKRNASPLPFECPPKSFDTSLNQNDNEIIENEMFETQNMENSEILSSDSEKKMSYSFTVNIGDEVIQLSTNNYSTGHKAKQILEQYLNKPLENVDKYEASDSNSDDNTVAAEKQILLKSNAIKKEVGFLLQRQLSATKIESFGNGLNRLQRSVSQGNVPIGRTSLRYLNTNKIHELQEYADNHTKNLITYDRDFLMSCAKSPLSQEMPTVISKLANKLPDIIRNNGQSQSTPPNNTYEW